MTHRNRIKSTFWSIIVLLGAYALSIAAPANSQEITGAVAVTATDGTGASVRGAQLTLTRTATGDLTLPAQNVSLSEL